MGPSTLGLLVGLASFLRLRRHRPGRSLDGSDVSRHATAVLAAAAVLALSATAEAAPSRARPASAQLQDCQEVAAFVSAPAERVMRHLPAGWDRTFTLQRDAFGNALLSVLAVRCDRVRVSAGDPGRPTTWSVFSAVVESPDGQDCFTAGGVPKELVHLCNWYPFFWVADNPLLVDWLRHGTPSFPALYVAGLRYDEDFARGGGLSDPAFSFQAPAPTPSPFRMTADAGAPLLACEPPFLSVCSRFHPAGRYWFATGTGIVKVAVGGSDFRTGRAADGRVAPEPGTAMADIFGADSRPFENAGLFASNASEDASYTKEVVPRGFGPSNGGGQ